MSETVFILYFTHAAVATGMALAVVDGGPQVGGLATVLACIMFGLCWPLFLVTVAVARLYQAVTIHD